jgi:hypothetical protein
MIIRRLVVVVLEEEVSLVAIVCKAGYGVAPTTRRLHRAAATEKPPS